MSEERGRAKMELFLQIVREQLEDYLAQELTEDILAGIERGIQENLWILEETEGEQ